MKPKKLPRSVKFFLLLMGFWGGSITTMILMAITYVIPSVIWILAGIFAVAMGLYLFISWKYRATLEEWDLIEPKKEKKK